MKEQQLLLEVLDIHLQGMSDAKERMIEDRTLGDLDTFSETLQQHDLDVATIKRIKRKVLDEPALG